MLVLIIMVVVKGFLGMLPCAKLINTELGLGASDSRQRLARHLLPLTSLSLTCVQELT